jgi:hypothetical protein
MWLLLYVSLKKLRFNLLYNFRLLTIEGHCIIEYSRFKLPKEKTKSKCSDL